jgi:hypothetical protein
MEALEAPIRSWVISRTGNGKRDRGRMEESVKIDLNDWFINKELALDRGVESSNSCTKALMFGYSSFIDFLCKFFLSFYSPFHLFCFCFFIIFSPFSI